MAPACTLNPEVCVVFHLIAAQAQHINLPAGAKMKRTLMLSVALLFGPSLAVGQKMPLEGVGTRHTPAVPAARAHGIALPGNTEGLDVPRVEIFASSSLVIPAPSWGLPSNTRGIGFDTSASINLNRWLATEADFGWNRAWADFPGVSVTDKGVLFSGGPRLTYRQGRLAVFSHALFGANRLTVSSSIPGISVLGVPIAGTSVTDTSVAAVFGGGADIEISTHVALRNQVDYLPTNHLRQMQNNHRFLFGFVVKL